jgi:tetratricopeptide (TPR) repeat protein
VLIGAIANFVIVFASSPAFNSTQRLESVVGGWRVPNTAAHYDKAEYLLELGFTYLNEIGVTVDPETGEVTIIDIEELDARTDKARELLEQSLRLDPANASAWAYLAQAQGRAEEIEAMRESLAQSWALAPNNVQLAPQRLELVIQIYLTHQFDPDQAAPLSDAEIASARRDSLVLNAQAPEEFDFLMADLDPLRAVLGDVETAASGS